MERFKRYLVEEFDQKALLPYAIKWLEKKFPKEEFGYTFKHVENVTNITKTYSVSIEGKEFDIEGRIFDANNSGEEDAGDVVQFKIVSSQEDEPEEEKASF